MKHLYTFFLICFSLTLIYGCLEDPEIPDDIINGGKPTISDYSKGEPHATYISVFAKISKHNGTKTTEQGYYLKKTGSEQRERIPVVGTIAENGILSFDTVIGNLTPGEEYTIFAFAVNALGESEVSLGTIQANDGLGTVLTLKPEDENIKGLSAIVGGELEYRGEGEIIRRGIYYSLSKDSLEKKTSRKDSVYITGEDNPYYCELKGLNPETTYYVQAFVRNEFGVFYGGIESLTTKDGKPIVTKPIIVSTDFTSVKLSAEITYKGDTDITAYGICWSKTSDPLPTIEDNKEEIEATGIGTFMLELKDLESDVRYYARAYAKNSLGVSYNGVEVLEFSTFSIKPTVETVDYTLNNTTGTVTVRGNVINEGMTSIVEAGFCWSVNSEPTIADSTVACFYSLGNYSGEIKTLIGGVTYYIRAYAKNATEVSYGVPIEVTPPNIFTQVSSSFLGISYTPNTNAYFTIEGQAYFLGGDIGPEYTDKLVAYNSVNGWMEKAPFIGGQRIWQTAVNVGNIVYVLGGIDKDNNLSDAFHSYWPYNNEWYEASKGPDARHSAVATSIGNSAFFIGGNKGVVTDEVWHYDNLLSPAWSQKTSIPVPQYGGIAVTVKNETTSVIYTGLGIRGNGTFNNQLWSSSDNCVTWVSETSFPVSVNAIRSAVAYRGLIYVLDEAAGIWEYNPVSKEWTQKSYAHAIGRYFHCMYALSDGIYLGLGQYSNMLIKYDPAWDH